MTIKDESVDIYGTNVEGIQVHLGKVPMPKRMKFKEMLCTYFGHRAAEDEDSEASLCLAVFDEYLAWEKEQSKS